MTKVPQECSNIDILWTASMDMASYLNPYAIVATRNYMKKEDVKEKLDMGLTSYFCCTRYLKF